MDPLTPDEADLTEIVLREEEAKRGQTFGRTATALGVLGLGLLSLPWLSLTLAERLRVGVPAAVVALFGAVMSYRMNVGRSRPALERRLLSIGAALAAVSLVYTLGVFSAAVAIIVFGLAFDPRDHLLARVIPWILGGSYLALAILVTAGVLPDEGLWARRGLEQHAAVTVVIGALLLLHVKISSVRRGALEGAVRRTHELARVVRTREAQLAEVQENLDAMLQRGTPGRRTGAVIDGYRIGHLVGRGGMGEVYEASPLGGGRPLAMKIVTAPDDPDIAARFVREAQIALRVRGPNLVEVFATGRTEDGAPYFTMELLAGRDLGAVLRQQETLSPSELADLARDVAAALTLLHEANIVHRDLKPQNLFLTADARPRWKVLDYGVSKLLDSTTMTRGDLVGTPAYMSPEQAEGEEVDGRSDLFSLASVLYRCATGRRPFDGHDMPQILYQIVHKDPPRPRQVDPLVPKALDAVIMRGLAKRRSDRYATAQAFGAAVDAAIAGRSDDVDEPSTVTPMAK